jgi:hypothetical protein
MLAALLALAALSGCRERQAQPPHQVLLGSVESVEPDSAQLTVRVRTARNEYEEDRRLLCLLSSGSEVYINDKFATAEAIAAGDTIEIYGYPDPKLRAERFVVSLAYITRPEPPPPEPNLPVPTTLPPTQPKGEATHG